MKRIIAVALTLTLALAMCACGQAVAGTDERKNCQESSAFTAGENLEADMVVYADQIYTANENGEFARAFAVKDGKFICVGTAEDVEKYVGSNTTVYNAAFVMPSGIEAHAHFLLEQAFMLNCYITPKNEDGTAKSKDEILAFIENYGIDNGIPDDPDGTLFGYGYTQMSFTSFADGQLVKQYTRADLDKLWGGKGKTIPVYIAEESLHEAWVSTATLVNAGIDLEHGGNDPTVGILRDKNGVATGVLTNEAVGYVLQNGYKKPVCSDIGYQKAVKNTCEYLNSMGYTGHYDAWTNFDGTEGIYKALHTVDMENDLTCFFTASYNIPTFEYKDGEALDAILDTIVDIRSNYQSTRVDPKFIKLFADGVLESGTGFMKEPYTGVYSGYGEQIWSQDDMNKIVAEANAKDLLVHVHTLGDASCSEAVQAFVNSNEVNGRKIRNSLGHCILIDDSDFSLIYDNNIGAAINCGWLAEAGDGIDLYDYIIGPERAKELYPAEKLIRQGIKAAISTDRPCAEGPIDIFDYMATIVLGYSSGIGNQVARRNVALSVGDAINMLTINGAWMANNENERGSIEVGKYADFIFANRSPFDCTPRLIQNIEVVSTCFEGKFVY